jgi:hypothetical protein
MVNFIKYLWKHHVRQQHEPDHFFSEDEAICVCGQRIAKNRKTGEWYPV